jgi:hypothetical protein
VTAPKGLQINLGAGTDILAGWVNQDVARLPGIDCVYDLNVRPWPWESGGAAEIKVYNVGSRWPKRLIGMIGNTRSPI